MGDLPHPKRLNYTDSFIRMVTTARRCGLVGQIEVTPR